MEGREQFKKSGVRNGTCSPEVLGSPDGLPTTGCRRKREERSKYVRGRRPQTSADGGGEVGVSTSGSETCKGGSAQRTRIQLAQEKRTWLERKGTSKEDNVGVEKGVQESGLHGHHSKVVMRTLTISHFGGDCTISKVRTYL